MGKLARRSNSTGRVCAFSTSLTLVLIVGIKVDYSRRARWQDYIQNTLATCRAAYEEYGPWESGGAICGSVDVYLAPYSRLSFLFVPHVQAFQGSGMFYRKDLEVAWKSNTVSPVLRG